MFLVTLQKGQRKVKTIGLVILANCWNHDRSSLSTGLMSYGVHTVAERENITCLIVQGGPEKKNQNYLRWFTPNMTFSLSHLSIFVSFPERFN